MSFQAQFRRSVIVNGTEYGGSSNLATDVPITFKDTIASGATSLPLGIACDVSTVQVIAIHSTRDLTLETWSAAPALLQTFNLKADQSISWKAGENILPWTGNTTTCPFTTDFASMKVTNASGVDATLGIAIGQSITP